MLDSVALEGDATDFGVENSEELLKLKAGGAIEVVFAISLVGMALFVEVISSDDFGEVLVPKLNCKGCARLLGVSKALVSSCEPDVKVVLVNVN